MEDEKTNLRYLSPECEAFELEHERIMLINRSRGSAKKDPAASCGVFLFPMVAAQKLKPWPFHFRMRCVVLSSYQDVTVMSLPERGSA